MGIREILTQLTEKLNVEEETESQHERNESYLSYAVTQIEAEILRRTIEYKPPEVAEAKPEFVYKVTEPDDSVYFMSADENPNEAFGADILVKRFRLVDGVDCPEFTKS